MLCKWKNTLLHALAICDMDIFSLNQTPKFLAQPTGQYVIIMHLHVNNCFDLTYIADTSFQYIYINFYSPQPRSSHI